MKCFSTTNIFQWNVATIILFTDEWSFPIPGRHNPLVGIGLGKITQKLNSGILGGQYCGAVFYLWRPQFPKVFATAAEQHDSCSSCFGPFYSIWLQQDGYPAHSSILVREYLSKLIPGRLIAGFCNIDGHIPWPARSHDLAPCHFYMRIFKKNVWFSRAEWIWMSWEFAPTIRWEVSL